MPKTEINHVSDTALWVAVYRARESRRKNPLFQDPFASLLAGTRGRQIAKSMSGSRYTSWSVVIRTYIIDAYLHALIAGEGVDTIINLGTGLDTRPYRLNLPPSLRWIEVDYPHMIELKTEKLAAARPTCRLERVKLDLADVEARREFFTRIGIESKKAVIITEGVIPYLTAEQVSSLAEDLHKQNSFRFWIIDYFAPQVQQFIRKKRMKKMKNAPFQFYVEDWFGFFKQHGWQLHTMQYLAEVSEKLGRSVPAPWWAKILRLIFFRSQKPKAYKKMMGYAVLEQNDEL